MRIKKAWITGLIILVGLLALPLFSGQYILLVGILICINVLLAASVRISLNAGQINLGTPAFMAIGGYCSALLMMKLQAPFWAAFLAGGVMAGLTSLIVGYPALRLKYVYFLMLTLGLVELVRVSAIRWESMTGGAVGLPSIPPIAFGGWQLTAKVPQYYFVVAATLVILFILYRLEYSRFGMILKSLSQSEELGETVGINTYTYKIMAFAISSFFCGLTGSLYAHTMSFLQPSLFGFMLANFVIVYCFVGGVGGFFGPVLGAVLLSLLTEPLRGLQYYERFFFAVILVLVILFLPGGLLSIPSKLAGLTDRLKAWGKTDSKLGAAKE